MRHALLAAAVLAMLRAPLAGALGLAPDEAYYWMWAQRLDWSYFDHAPMVGWLIAAATALLGDGVAAVRLPALVAGFVAPVALAYVAWVLAPEGRRDRAALFTAVLAGVMPAMHAAGVVVTPDSPQAMFWSLTMAALAAALFRGWTAGWYLAGVALGLAMLSKYTTVTLGGSMALLAFLDADTRRHLRTPHPWIAAVICIVLFLPVVHWNATHDWISFRFQLGHGTDREGGVGSFLQFLLAQIAILTPMIAALVVLHVMKGGMAATRQGDRFLTASIVPTAVFFGFMAARSRPEANWPAMAWLAAAVVGGLAAARAADEGSRWLRRLYASALVTGAVASILLSVHALTPLVTIPRDRLFREFHRWDQRVEAAVAAAGPGGVLLGDGYQMASEIAYHCSRRGLCDPQKVGVVRKSKDRLSMYDLWPTPRIEPGANAIWVAPRKRKVPAELAPLFARVAPVPLPAGVKGRLYRLEEFGGEGWPIVHVAGDERKAVPPKGEQAIR